MGTFYSIAYVLHDVTICKILIQSEPDQGHPRPPPPPDMKLGAILPNFTNHIWL